MMYIIIQYQEIINLLDNTTNEPSKFRTKNWIEINDESWRKYDNSSINFKASVTRSDLCDCTDAYILASGTITVTGAGNHNNTKRTCERNKGFRIRHHLLIA